MSASFPDRLAEFARHQAPLVQPLRFVQYNSLTEQATTNARLRYNFREGQDLWLVWNEGLNIE